MRLATVRQRNLHLARLKIIRKNVTTTKKTEENGDVRSQELRSQAAFDDFFLTVDLIR